MPRVVKDRRHVWHQYTVLVDPASGVSRQELSDRLAELGVGSGIYYPKVVFDYDCYRSRPEVKGTEVPVAEAVSGSCLSLPVHPGLSDDDIKQIIDSVAAIMGGAS